jgi:hypothetical protein
MSLLGGPRVIGVVAIVFYEERDDADGAVQDVLQATFAMGDLTSSQWRMADGRVLDAPPC